MCKISFERCICLVFLIISLVVLICSGIPIDNAYMSPSSKRYLSGYDNVFLRRIFRQSQDRVRHFRAPHNKPTGHIEATVYQNLTNDPITSDLITIPMPLTNKPVRSQRSSGNSRHRIKSQCQPEHFSMRAYQSDIVLRVKAQGIERTNYTVSFFLNENFPEHRLKVPPSVPIHECLTLQFSNRTRNCHPRDKKNLVKADIKVSDEYIVFLNITHDNKCTPSFPPERISHLNENRQDFMMKILKKVCSDRFVPKTGNINVTLRQDKHPKDGKRKLKLICKRTGLPVPTITWKRNNRTIVSDHRTLIHDRKRKSVLVIRDPVSEDYDVHYSCIARGVNGFKVTKTITVSEKSSQPSTEKTRCSNAKKTYCMTGTCYVDFNNQMYCECGTGYKGARCEQKDTTPSISSSLDWKKNRIGTSSQ